MPTEKHDMLFFPLAQSRTLRFYCSFTAWGPCWNPLLSWPKHDSVFPQPDSIVSDSLNVCGQIADKQEDSLSVLTSVSQHQCNKALLWF